jgi:methionyl-tRNA formyltransferase
LRIVVAATPDVAIASLNAILESEHELLSVITTPNRPSGRGLTLSSSAVARWADEKKVMAHKPERGADLKPLLNDVDLLITIGYGVILAEEVFAAPRFGSLNLHFSLLPRWRGAAPVQRAIEAGDQLTGVTVFQLDTGMDTGPIYTQLRFALDDDITSDELFIELADLGAQALLTALSEIETGKKPKPQETQGQTRAAKLSKDEGEIDWDRPAPEISSKIRAFTSIPGAWTTFRGSTLKLDTPTISESSAMQLKPGEITLFDKKLYVGTSTLAVEVRYLTPQGKSRMSAAEWANGARLASGEFFG